MEAAQAASIEMLRDQPGPLQTKATVVWHEHYQNLRKKGHAGEAPDLGEWLERPTFFTELRQPARSGLRKEIWPGPASGSEREQFLDQELRAQLLASAARLGHSMIDLYVLVMGRLRSFRARVRERGEGDDLGLIEAFLDLLERQRTTPLLQRDWGAFDELAEIGRNFDLILVSRIGSSQTKALDAF
jgi:hypothetical protein